MKQSIAGRIPDRQCKSFRCRANNGVDNHRKIALDPLKTLRLGGSTIDKSHRALYMHLPVYFLNIKSM
jgi:hypothetical protein